MSQICYILCGIPGSGKSTFAKKNLPNAVLISRDICRVELGFTTSVDDKFVGNREQESQVTILETQKIKEAIESGKDIVLDNINGGPYLQKTVDTVKSFNPDIKIFGCNIMTPLEVCIVRRKGQIHENIMRNIHSRFSYISRDNKLFDNVADFSGEI
jgi:predicted kinase